MMMKVCLLLNLADAQNATKFLMTDAAETHQAKCLDGSPGAYYFLAGNGTGANKWYIHHQGGGWCESMDDCLDRSTTPLGSSATYPDTDNLGGGYFDTTQAKNPLMYNWNKVLMKYCDGASFSGNNAESSVYKNVTLRWRGMHIREAIAEDLFTNRGMDKVCMIILDLQPILPFYLSTRTRGVPGHRSNGIRLQCWWPRHLFAHRPMVRQCQSSQPLC